MFKPRSSAKPPTEENQHPTEQPKDALAALMDGETPDDKSLRFPNERSTSWRASPSSASAQPPKNSSAMHDYGGDYHFNSTANSNIGEYRPAKQNSTIESVKTGAVKSGAYIKDRSLAGATYVREKDWSKEKGMAGKAETATKNGAVYVGSGMAKGAGWLWNSGKTGIESLKNKDKK